MSIKPPGSISFLSRTVSILLRNFWLSLAYEAQRPAVFDAAHPASKRLERFHSPFPSLDVFPQHDGQVLMTTLDSNLHREIAVAPWLSLTALPSKFTLSALNIANLLRRPGISRSKCRTDRLSSKRDRRPGIRAGNGSARAYNPPISSAETTGIVRSST